MNPRGFGHRFPLANGTVDPGSASVTPAPFSSHSFIILRRPQQGAELAEAWWQFVAFASIAPQSTKFALLIKSLRSLRCEHLKSSGGPEGIRTPYLFHAMEALYQLSYGPVSKVFSRPTTQSSVGGLYQKQKKEEGSLSLPPCRNVIVQKFT